MWPASPAERRNQRTSSYAEQSARIDDANEDDGIMSKFVPYLAEEVSERAAEALLSEFAHARGLAIELPVPIEDIVEKHLKLGIEFDDTHRLFGVPRSGLNRG